MERSWNDEKKFFAQSYEDLDVLDSAVLVMPLVFFINGKCPRLCVMQVFGALTVHQLPMTGL